MAGTCLHEPDDGMCAPAEWCLGSGHCDAVSGCSVVPRDCSDGIGCHVGSCDADAGDCEQTFDSSLCPSGLLCGDAGCVQCLTDVDCDDHVACTVDTCLPSGSCAHSPQDGLCPQPAWCDGEARCDVDAGCVETPRNCSDGIFCVVDGCDADAGACTHVPDDSLCPDGELCGPTGCGVLAYAVSSDTLYSVDLPSGAAQAIGGPGFVLGYTDVALSPDGKLYGIDGNVLFAVDRLSGAQTLIGTGKSGGDALDAAEDGTLYGAGSDVYVVDTRTGSTTHFANLPPGMVASGDIAFVDGGMYVSVTDGMSPTDFLCLVPPAPLPPTSIGPIGFSQVWGLAAYGSTLYGFVSQGAILTIDVTTGAGTQVAQTNISFYGASSR